MTSRDFCYWLQGFFEITADPGRTIITEPQVETIRRHLAMVFKHEIDPSMGDVGHQGALQVIHNGGSTSFPPFDGTVRC